MGDTRWRRLVEMSRDHAESSSTGCRKLRPTRSTLSSQSPSVRALEKARVVKEGDGLAEEMAVLGKVMSPSPCEIDTSMYAWGRAKERESE